MYFTVSVVQRKVVIPNKYGEKLVGVLHETESPEIVILCHGFRSSKVGVSNMHNRSFLFICILSIFSSFQFD
jgi:hypothetical protein